MGMGGMCMPGCGQMGGGHGGGGACSAPGGDFACCPDLTDEQKAEIEKIRTADEGKMISLRKELMRIRHELRGEMMKDDPSGSTARKLAEKIGEIRTDMQVAHLEIQLAIRKVLTPEQRDRCLLMGHGRGCFGDDGGCRMGRRGGDDGRPGPLMRHRSERFGGRGQGAEEQQEGSM
jgi:Spy/CpxP family protein refolding chaperone